MILIRSVEETDLPGLETLSEIAAERHPGFLNIANDRDQWRDKVLHSIESFSGRLTNKMEAKYVFVAEHLQKKRIVGVSMIAAQHGTEESPHFYFEVSHERKFSTTINTGFIHGTLKLKTDSNGPTEIGGLLVDPEFRNDPARIGRQISFIRFLFLGTHKSLFKRRVLAELLPPLTKRGKSPLWEAVGRRFTNMDYTEADILSSKNKEFIFSLFPTGRIYVSFLGAEARNAIGKVSKDTEPVMHMLKKIGFQYRNQVDPFDGGPHLIANVDEILPIKKLRTLTVEAQPNAVAVDSANIAPLEGGLISPVNVGATGRYLALAVEVPRSTEPSSRIQLSNASMERLNLKPGDSVHFMPYY